MHAGSVQVSFMSHILPCGLCFALASLFQPFRKYEKDSSFHGLMLRKFIWEVRGGTTTGVSEERRVLVSTSWQVTLAKLPCRIETLPITPPLPPHCNKFIYLCISSTLISWQNVCERYYISNDQFLREIRQENGQESSNDHYKHAEEKRNSCKDQKNSSSRLHDNNIFEQIKQNKTNKSKGANS